MRTRTTRRRWVRLVPIFAIAALSGAVLQTAAYAGAPADPPGGATPVAPHFYNGNVEGIRGAGSDTTLFLEEALGNLYTNAGLYGCTLNNGAGQTLYNTSDPAATASNEEYYCQADQNQATTDVNDNWDRTEVTQGVDDIGSTGAQEQLCGNVTSPLPIDYVRASKPPLSVSSGGCTEEASVGFAKDGVPAIDFQTLNPSTYGTSTASSTTDDYASINSGKVGPVADGWIPTDAVGGPYHGTAFTNVSNADNGGGASSTAYRLWCTKGGSGSAAQITDWGSLTNLGPTLAVVNATVSGGSLTAAPEASSDGDFTGSTSAITFPSNVAGATVTGSGVPSGVTVTGGQGSSTLTLSNTSFSVSNENLTLTFASGESALAVGQGVPDGIPVRIAGVNTNSGVESTFASFANSGVTSGLCSSNLNGDAANDANSATAASPNTAHILLQNNASQIAIYAASDFPSDLVDQAIDIETTLYFESNGVYNTNPYAGEVDLTNGPTSTTYTASKISLNGKTTTTPNLLNNIYPTAITLSNIYRTDLIRASAGGFLDWLCDSNSDFQKGTDNDTGVNYDTEVNTLISTTYGFPRLSDTSTAASTGEPADNIPASNTSCASGTTTNGSGQTVGNGIPAITSVASPQT
jgi:hypothetical protein